MGKLIDLTGRRFGRLIVVSRAEADGPTTRWHVRCDCGATKIIAAQSLRDGVSESCGCLRREQIAGRNLRHGGSRTREYDVWQTMHFRCTNPAARQWSDYGGRGIKVCERWSKYEHFIADMGARPSSSHTIERLDNDGPYAPDNCEWATRSKNNRNRRSTRRLTYLGLTLPMVAWSELLGVPYGRLAARVAEGWSDERVLTTPLLRSAKTEVAKSPEEVRRRVEDYVQEQGRLAQRSA